MRKECTARPVRKLVRRYDGRQSPIVRAPCRTRLDALVSSNQKDTVLTIMEPGNSYGTCIPLTTFLPYQALRQTGQLSLRLLAWDSTDWCERSTANRIHAIWIAWTGHTFSSIESTARLLRGAAHPPPRGGADTREREQARPGRVHRDGELEATPARGARSASSPARSESSARNPSNRRAWSCNWPPRCRTP